MTSRLDLFSEMNDHLLHDDEPSIYCNCAFDDFDFLEYPFTMLSKLKATKQSPMHHPEGNVWNHTMLVIDVAAQVKSKSCNANVFMWAALLHDIGKPDTTKNRNGKITAYDHDKLGAKIAKQFLKEFGCDENFITAVSVLVKWHMQLLFVANSLPFADIKKMKSQTAIDEVALLGFCDRMGRLGANRMEEEQNITLFLNKCKITKKQTVNRRA